MVTYLRRGADLHVAQLLPLPLTVSWFYLVLAHPGSSGQKPESHKTIVVVVVVVYYFSFHMPDTSLETSTAFVSCLIDSSQRHTRPALSQTPVCDSQVTMWLLLHSGWKQHCTQPLNSPQEPTSSRPCLLLELTTMPLRKSALLASLHSCICLFAYYLVFKARTYTVWESSDLVAASICRLSVCHLSCIRSRKLSEIGAKFRHLCRKSGSWQSHTWTLNVYPTHAEFALEVAK